MIALNTYGNKGYLPKRKKMGDKDVGIWLWNHLQKGEEIFSVDALFRKYEDVEALLCAISIIQLDWIAKEMDEWKNDKTIWTFIQKF